MFFELHLFLFFLNIFIYILLSVILPVQQNTVPSTLTHQRDL